MLSTALEEGELYLGRGAGRRLHTALERAQKSIKVFSPYVSYSSLDVLLLQSARGVNVSLITTSAAVNKKFYRKLIRQHRHTLEEAVLKKKKGRWVSLLLFSLCLCYGIYAYTEQLPAFSLFGYSFSHIYCSLALCAILLLVFRSFSKIPIYRYSYSRNIRFSVVESPHDEGGTKSYFAHAKYYIIDDEIAFLGSLNFTPHGMKSNYESCIVLKDTEVIKKIDTEFEWMGKNDHTQYRDTDNLGPNIYKEAPF